MQTTASANQAFNGIQAEVVSDHVEMWSEKLDCTIIQMAIVNVIKDFNGLSKIMPVIDYAITSLMLIHKKVLTQALVLVIQVYTGTAIKLNVNLIVMGHSMLE